MPLQQISHEKAAVSFQSVPADLNWQLRPRMLSIDTFREVKKSHLVAREWKLWLKYQIFFEISKSAKFIKTEIHENWPLYSRHKSMRTGRDGKQAQTNQVRNRTWANENKPMRTGMQLSFPIGIHSPRSIINDCLQCTVYDDMEHVITTALCLLSLGRVPPYCGTSTMGSFRTVAGGGCKLLQKVSGAPSDVKSMSPAES